MRHAVNADSIRTVISADAADRETRLHQLGSLTDAELTTLDPEDFLAELLRRLCDALGLDVAAILLLDQHAQQLVTTAAVGLEEEVRQRFRLPVGVGFAGKVARLRRPITAENVNPDEIASPVLRAKNVRSLAGVPVLIDDDLVGVLKVGTLQPRTFTDDDIRLLQRAADRAATASQTRRNTLDSQAALALQRGLLPTRLPSVPGIDLAARYVPGQDAGVGGDWYDVFLLPDDSLGIVVGDVAGHGLPSAVVMGRLRSALRAYALEHSDPAEVLTRLDRKIHHFEAGNLATAIYAVIPPDRNRALISNAGHLPPVLAVPGQQARSPRRRSRPPSRHWCRVPLDRPPASNCPRNQSWCSIPMAWSSGAANRSPTDSSSSSPRQAHASRRSLSSDHGRHGHHPRLRRHRAPDAQTGIGDDTTKPLAGRR